MAVVRGCVGIYLYLILFRNWHESCKRRMRVKHLHDICLVTGQEGNLPSLIVTRVLRAAWLPVA